jgi:hypothetical protein
LLRIGLATWSVFERQPAVGVGELAGDLMKEAATDAGNTMVLSGQQAGAFARFGIPAECVRTLRSIRRSRRGRRAPGWLRSSGG